jgi:hypothetical protein
MRNDPFVEKSLGITFYALRFTSWFETLSGTLLEAIMGRSSGIMQPESLRDVLLKGWSQYQGQGGGNCQEAAFGQAIKNLVSGVTRQRPSKGRVPCGEYNHLLEKAA